MSCICIATARCSGYSELCTCGMQSFDAYHPFYGVLVNCEGLLCSDPMEIEYFTHKKKKAPWYHPELCAAYCVGVNDIGYVDEELNVEWTSLLPICKSCKDEGALPLVRSIHPRRGMGMPMRGGIGVAHAPIVILLGGGR